MTIQLIPKTRQDSLGVLFPAHCQAANAKVTDLTLSHYSFLSKEMAEVQFIYNVFSFHWLHRFHRSFSHVHLPFFRRDFMGWWFPWFQFQWILCKKQQFQAGRNSHMQSVSNSPQSSLERSPKDTETTQRSHATSSSLLCCTTILLQAAAEPHFRTMLRSRPQLSRNQLNPVKSTKGHLLPSPN